MLGNVFQIVYFGVRNIVCWVCVCVLFLKKANNGTAQMRGRDVAKMPQWIDAWERRDHLHRLVEEKSESLLSGRPKVFHSLQ